MTAIGTTSAEYDRFADIYAVWTETAASSHANLAFYVDAYLAVEGLVVELGVGDGRIAVQAARQGRDIIGVDLSAAMLARCRHRGEEAGVLDRLTLLHADFRDFQLEAPASLIALPYHSLGHLLTLGDKRQALTHVYSQLRPGGLFIFDDFLMTPALVDHMRRVQLRAEYRSPAGVETLLWVASLVHEASQVIRVVTWEDEADAEGVLTRRRYRRLSLSWLEPAQARSLLIEAGFEVEACFGDFARTPFSPDTAHEQVALRRLRRLLEPVAAQVHPQRENSDHDSRRGGGPSRAESVAPTELFLYPGNTHGIPDARNQLLKSMSEMAWMDYYVRGKGEKFSWRDILATIPK